MADLTRYSITGYSVLELNNVAFRRDGRIEAQLPLDSTDFATVDAEAGMLLKVTPGVSINLPADNTEKIVALHYTTEKLYNQFAGGLNKWSLSEESGFLPRLGYLSEGDKFTTNCISYMKGDGGFAANDAAAKVLLDAAQDTPVYGVPCANGSIEVVAADPRATSKVVLQVVKTTTMPNGDFGVQFICIQA